MKIGDTGQDVLEKKLLGFSFQTVYCAQRKNSDVKFRYLNDSEMLVITVNQEIMQALICNHNPHDNENLYEIIPLICLCDSKKQMAIMPFDQSTLSKEVVLPVINIGVSRDYQGQRESVFMWAGSHSLSVIM